MTHSGRPPLDPQAIWAQHYDHPMPWASDYPPMTLVEMWQDALTRFADRHLLDFMGRKYSYAEVGDMARRVAAGLQAMGIGKGDRVGLFLPNVPQYVAGYYGALLAGATVVNFSPLYSVEELAHQVNDSGTRLLITLSAKALLPTALKVLDGSSLERLVVGSIAGGLSPLKGLAYRLLNRKDITPIPDDPRITRFSALVANRGDFTPVSIDAMADVALIQYTGGTTGTPKGARLSHQNICANARQVNDLDPWRDDGDDRILGVLPFFHVFANTCVLNRSVRNGAEIVMLPRFDAKAALAAIKRCRVTAMPGVPTMYQALLDHPDTATTDFSSLRVCISGGAPMPKEVKQRFEAITGARLVEGYGLTESSGVVSANPYASGGKQGTIGQPIPGTMVRLASRDDPAQPAPTGEPGEIIVAGPQIMQGYWNNAAADLDSFVTLADGAWLRTGDIGQIDEEGYIRIVDRLKDMIATSGFKVYPSTIEAVLYQNPAVREALVIGVPDAYRGESPRAFVSLADGVSNVTADDLKTWLNAQLGKHERVDAVVIRDALPKTMVGKLDRKALRASLEAEGQQA